jgi:hypothetical protein
MSRRRTGDENQKPNLKTSEAGNARLAKTKKRNVREAHTKPPLTLFPLCVRRVAQDSRGLTDEYV